MVNLPHVGGRSGGHLESEVKGSPRRSAPALGTGSRRWRGFAPDHPKGTLQTEASHDTLSPSPNPPSCSPSCHHILPSTDHRSGSQQRGHLGLPLASSDKPHKTFHASYTLSGLTFVSSLRKLEPCWVVPKPEGPRLLAVAGEGPARSQTRSRAFVFQVQPGLFLSQRGFSSPCLMPVILLHLLPPALGLCNPGDPLLHPQTPLGSVSPG